MSGGNNAPFTVKHHFTNGSDSKNMIIVVHGFFPLGKFK